MAYDFSRNLLVGVTTESVYNTFTVSNEEGFRVLPGARMTTEQDIRTEHSARNQAAQSPYDSAQGLRRWTFECSMNMPKESLCFLLARLFGATVTTAATDYYKHVISINDPALGTDPTPTSLSLRLIDDNKQWQLSGGVLTKMRLAMNLEGFWQVSLSFIGGSYEDAAVGSAPSYTVPAAGRHFYTSDDFTFTVEGASWYPEAMEVEFVRTYAEGTAESYVAGAATDAAARERTRLVSAGAPAFEATGFTRRVYDGITEFDLFDGYTEVDVSFETRVNATENLVAVNGNGYAFKVNLAKCRIENWDKEDSSGLTLQRLAFRAFYTAAADIQVTTQDKIDATATGLPDEGTA